MAAVEAPLSDGRTTALNISGISGIVAGAPKPAGRDLAREDVVDALDAAREGFAGPPACGADLMRGMRPDRRPWTGRARLTGNAVDLGPIRRTID